MQMILNFSFRSSNSSIVYLQNAH